MQNMDRKTKSELVNFSELNKHKYINGLNHLEKEKKAQRRKDSIRKEESNKTNVIGDNNKVSTTYNVIKNKPAYITFAIIIVGGITLNWSTIINITVNVIIG